jgi:hypothetical protein
MAPQCFQRVVVTFKLFVRQHGVDLPMARPTKIDEAASHLMTRKIFFIFLILVPRPRNEMMLGDLIHLTTAQLTRWHHASTHWPSFSKAPPNRPAQAMTPSRPERLVLAAIFCYQAL